MRSFARTLGRIFFWSYERGSLPYDIAVILIVAFVLATPRSWFHDRPQIGAPAAAEAPAVQLLSSNPADGTEVFRVEARALALPVATPELERRMHDAVRKNAPDLQGRSFRIVLIDPVRDADGNVSFYRVSVRP